MRSAASPAGTRECLRVLVVEDNARDARAVRALLHADGAGAAEIVHVRTLMGAVETLRRRATDVVLASPRLPDAAGNQAIKEVIDAAEDVPVVVLAAPTDAISAAEALRLGAHEHLIKGIFDGPTLWRAIRNARERRRMARDLEGARAAEAEARAALRELFEASDDGLLVVGADARVRYANAAAGELYATPPASIVGLPFPHALVPGSRFRIQVAGPEGADVTLEASASDIRWEGAPSVLVRLSEADGSFKERKPTRPERARLESVGRIATGIAHDVDNLLTALHVATNLAEERLLGESAGKEEAVARRLASIDACAHRAAVLVRRLLAIGRRRVGPPEPVDVHRLLDAMRPILRSTLGDAVRVTAMPRATRTWVRADAGSLEDAMLDLAIYAHETMGPEGGDWLVETDDVVVEDEEARECGVAAGPYLRVSFSDTGPGTDVDRLPRLFDPRSGGFGPTPDLAEAGAIVRSAFGALSVESAPGAGTSFRMLLPLVEAPPTAEPEPAPSAATARVAPASATILLVEDMPELREIARDSLTEAGYRVLEACSGDEGVRAFTDAPVPVDLVVTDVVMPGSSGPEMVRALRERKPDLRALFMSSRSGEDLAQLWRVAPGDGYLEKPFRKGDFLGKVADALGAPAAAPDADLALTPPA